MINHYSEFDELLSLCDEVKQYVLANAESFASKESDKTAYSTPSLLLGLHTPSLLLGIGYSKAFKKGKKLSSPGERSDYLSYDYDSDGKLIRITDHGDRFFYVVVERHGYQWAVPIYFCDNNYSAYPYYIKASKWDENGRVLVFAQLRGYENRIEKYRYPTDEENIAFCEYWDYVPELSHASKEKPVSETGSPAQLWIYKLDLTDPKKITGILTESYSRDDSAYRSDPQCLIAPQIAYKME